MTEQGWPYRPTPDDLADAEVERQRAEQEAIAQEQIDAAEQHHAWRVREGRCPHCGAVQGTTIRTPNTIARRDAELAAAYAESDRALARFRESGA